MATSLETLSTTTLTNNDLVDVLREYFQNVSHETPLEPTRGLPWLWRLRRTRRDPVRSDGCI